jgi:GMP synthase (glutamine-hydrolysing)
MKRLIIVKTGSKIPSLAGVDGDYEQWIARGLGKSVYPIAVVDAARGAPLPDPSTVAAIVITGSAAMVTERAAWMEQGAAWLRGAVAAEVPLLGICFGHQLLAWALGGEVGYNPRGVEVGTATIRLVVEAQQDPLFSGMPATFPAQVSHRQSVLRLPAGARLLAASDKEPHQAFAVGACAWGVQFHPEFDAPIIRHFIEHYRERLLGEGDSAERLLGAVRDSPHSASLLGRFARLAQGAGGE